MQPHRRQPTRLPRPWDSPGKNTGVGCHFLLQYMKVKSESEVAQSCPTLSDSMDCSLPGSSIHGIFQAKVLEWGAIAFSVRTYKTTQKCTPDMLSMSFREELKILWLLYDWSIVKLLPVLLANCYFLLLHFHILSIINSWVSFCNSGEAQDSKAFL